ncbi:hypothetical protein WICPIJ_005513 [Wickerhamomyces pijperi]|uniref:Uncharacterized protein n=1 Tax=Wickerhamomyces pijperi TaxID=599730 RepID=A0A9P8Q5L4_WICPI|nr:hypothetical protein WICPIJ_005513 [Wickerhamomyces pijperi]
MNQFYLPRDITLMDEELPITELLDQLEQCTDIREFSFFDEVLVGYVSVIRQPNEDITSTRLDVQIINAGGEADSNGQIITLHKLELKPLKSADDVVIYKFSTFINYPKIKLYDPILKFTLFSCFKKLKPVKTDDISTTPLGQESYLQTEQYMMERRNLLAGYQSVRSNEIKPVMYDTSTSSVWSSSNAGDSDDHEEQQTGSEEEGYEDGEQLPTQEPQAQLHNASMVSLSTTKERTTQIYYELPLIRVLNIKVKNFKISKTSIISTIDIELTAMFQEYLDSSVTLSHLNYKFENNLITNTATTFPITLRSKDYYKFSYKLNLMPPYYLQSDAKMNIPSNHNKSLIELQYAFNGHKLKTSFITNLDMSSFYQQQQHSSRSVSSSSLNLSRIPNTLPSSITVRFRGNKVVKLGDVFKMKVIIQNHSKKPRDLVITFNNNSGSSSTTSSSGYPDYFQPNLPKIQTPIQPLSSISKTYNNIIKSKPVGALSLVNELRFQLNSFNDIYENEIKLIALERSSTSSIGGYGINGYRLTGIRVTDINSGESMSCDKMLEVIIE